MEQRYVALWRGINVGRAKRIAMADLRSLLSKLGYTNVRTVLNSGNAIFASTAASPTRIAEQIRGEVATRLEVDAGVIVKTAAEVIAAFEANPLRAVAGDASRYVVAFTPDAAALAPLRALTKRDWAPEALAVGNHAAYLWCANGILASKLGPEVDAKLGELRTTRNWATLEKIAALLQP
jgi:uncharacterized protein (DUF1697 family)